MEDANIEQSFEFVTRDLVPAPALKPEDPPQKLIADLCAWLQPTDFLSPGNGFMKHLRSHAPGTSRWFQNSSILRAWAGVHADPKASSCLHVCGVAGSGKSVLAANTIHWLQQSGRVVLFFFFRQIVDKNHRAKYLVRDFAAQLLPHCPALATSLMALSQNHAISDCEMDLVWPAITKALTEEGVGEQVFCVVDALDEMDDCDFGDMARRLVAFGTSKPEKIRVMMTSRPLPEILQALADPHIRQFKLDPALLSSDVARYVDDRMATFEPALGDEKKELVAKTICDRAGGLFLHARLVLDSLVEGLQDGRITEETLPDSLDRLPRALHGVYESALAEHARRSGIEQEQQAKILMCVTHTSRPLRLIELGSLLSRMLKLDLRQGKDLARAACGRLLEVLEDESVTVIHHSFTEFLQDVSRDADLAGFPVLDSATSHSMLAVLSLEYLYSCPKFDMTIDDKTGANQDFGSYFENYSYHSSERARRDEICTDTRICHPLAEYAASNLSFHLDRAAEGGPTHHLLTALDRYFTPEKPALENWALFMGWRGRLSASVNVFHLAAAIRDHQSLPLFVLDHFAKTWPESLSARDSDGRTPLSYAAQSGQAEIVSFLLAKGSDPGASGKDGLTPLHWAVYNEHLSVVKLLLDAGADPLTKRGPVLKGYDEREEEKVETWRETALGYAFAGEDPHMIEAFMPFIPPDMIHRFFQEASDEKIIETFLDTNKVDVDSLWEGKTKLYQATANCWPGVVELLIRRGADPNKRCWPRRGSKVQDRLGYYEGGPTPLHGLAVQRSTYRLSKGDQKDAEQIVRALVGAGADVNATVDGWDDATSMTPLHLSLRSADLRWNWDGSNKSAEILTGLFLTMSADPKAKTKDGNTPMHIADPRKAQLIDMLVSRGADINSRNALGRTPFLEILYRLGTQSIHQSFQQLCIESLNKLLDLDADPNAVDNNGDTAFHHILGCLGNLSSPESECILLLKRLLQAGVGLSKKNKKGQPPLLRYNGGHKYFRAAGSDDEKTLRALISFGMDVNVKDDLGRNVLWAITEPRSEDLNVLEKFIRLGANVKERASDGQTLLHAAVKHERSADWVRLLVSEGVDPAITSADGDTPIHTLLVELQRRSLSSWYAQKILPVLVDIGVSPLVSNAKGQTVLHLAGDLHTLERIVTASYFQGLDINQPDLDGFTPLHFAVQLGEVAASVHVKFGANPMALSATGLSPLHLAARHGEAGVVVMLLAKYRERGVLGKYVNMIGEGRTPLHYACRSGSPESVWALLCNGADPRREDEMGLTPLHAMAESHGLSCLAKLPEAPTHAAEMIEMLQQAGVDLTAETTIRAGDGDEIRKVSPLDLAVERRSWGMVRELLSRGAKIRDRNSQSEEFILATDKNKAVEEARVSQARLPGDEGISGHDGHWRGRWAFGAAPVEERTRFILGGQAILDAQTEFKDGKPLHLDMLSAALRDGDYDSVKEYAQLGGNVLALRYGPEGNDTLLHCLVKWGCVELLGHFCDSPVKLGAQARIQEGGGGFCGTLLGTACERSHPSLHIIQLLIERIGIDVDVVDSRSGGTAVHILAQGGHWWQVEALKYILAQGGDIEARNKTGMTPLLAAIYRTRSGSLGRWNEEAVRVLLEHGANPNETVMVRKVDGTTEPGLSALEMWGEPGIVKLLLDYGASMKEFTGLVARAIKETMEPRTVKLLLDAGGDPNELSQVASHQQIAEYHNRGVEESEHQGASDEEEEESEEEYVRRKIHRELGAHKRFANPRYALHEAARPTDSFSSPADYEQRQLAIMELLLCKGANPWATYTDGSSALQRIIEDRGLVAGFIPRCTEEHINRKGGCDRTLLASACIPLCRAGYHYLDARPKTVMTDTVHVLLEHRANPLLADDGGRTPLHWFCTLDTEFDEPHRKAFVALVDHGPDAVHMADLKGRKPIHLALEKYEDSSQMSTFAIRHLMAAGAEMSESDPVTSNSALHTIAPRLVGEKTAGADAATLFRDVAITIDINTRNASGETPVFSFMAAGWKGTRDADYALAHDIFHDTSLAMFIELGVDLMAVDARGRTLLHAVADRNVRDTGVNWDQMEDVERSFQVLMELGVDPHREDQDLRTAADVAVARRLRRVVDLFGGKDKIEEDDKE
ncbi:ankyrin repeat-containing protein [Colletotrichum scovillei]|uniref:Ankyrin repeat-containing protein n=1 Tax=Colletotrichum scovillei TaxID=1209932 RepID=A0A9P7RI53_9PEZI|nr:ankyrin repeat-containing protein [Colletotrichum scovillei]KAG7075929.1 ankyrin repeat-containing protein [Colletotrichum scovillei]KAG7083109.1 ankyrin repeat-containing protein [Colletotrichum scovillei]